MNKLLSLCVLALLALLLSGCGSLPQMMTSGVGIVKISNTTPAAVVAAAEEIYTGKGYKRSSSKSANPLTYDKPAGALNTHFFPPSVREGGIRVNLWISPIGETGQVRLEQKAFVLGKRGQLSPVDI
jgi:hypothetical protein